MCFFLTNVLISNYRALLQYVLVRMLLAFISIQTKVSPKPGEDRSGTTYYVMAQQRAYFWRSGKTVTLIMIESKTKPYTVVQLFNAARACEKVVQGVHRTRA